MSEVSHDLDVDPRSVAAATRDADVDVGALVAALGGTMQRQLEASVRWRSDGVVEGNRVMVEQASAACVEGIFAALACPLAVPARRLLDVAHARNLPLIAGWDAAGPDVVAKLYVNASDLADEERLRSWRDAHVPLRAPAARPAHIVALNAARSGATTWKAYLQDADAIAMAAVLGEPATSLAADATGADVAAGAVTCWEADGRARAFFVALRERHHGAVAAWLATRRGLTLARLDAVLPFERGECRSIGVSLAGDLVATAYFKSRGLGTTLWQLEPTASFRAAAGDELAVYITPSTAQERAFARTEAHALSYRVREGRPAPAAVESLMAWVVERVRLAEREGREVGDDLGAPPHPWTVVARPRS